ncbi:MAG: hypothetical protein ACRC5C_13615 [Bacilli bacterium]
MNLTDRLNMPIPKEDDPVNLDEHLKLLNSLETNAATKADLELKADKETTYTKEEVDARIENIVPPELDLSTYAKKEDVYTKAEVDERIENIVPPDMDLSSYATKVEVALKADKTYVDEELTKKEVKGHKHSVEDVDGLDEKINKIIETSSSSHLLTIPRKKGPFITLETREE